MAYYLSEVQNKNSFRKAELLVSENLKSAKEEALEKQCFYGTVLEIAEEVDEDGFIQDPIAFFKNGYWI